ncbi:hypothetical protein KKR91_12390 [Arthrobacter jiangjiafuii]|uniref:Uncharacterized protein n=1 Tax=Arthrobacter jiangjiafuii TaxID=2817475 RepID=A0A975M3I0_9MICC|nr:DUF6541 family protein [Arthrobacter jiangjiafuii]MBP3044616.1 hypothetical protein [Arthrobacter jiangjiafuii]QWC09286.1 hypothetical protein KKR91_12390 [Arthrobacter jiangjiafuii]
MLPLFLATTGVFLLPGLLIALLGGVRGFALLALAPALTVTIVSVGAILAPLAGLNWIVGVAVLMVAAAGAALGAWWWVGRRSAPERHPSNGAYNAALAGAVVVAVFLIGRRLLFAFGEPDSFSQTFDNVFHLNAIRYILETGAASTFEVGQMAGNSYYPAAWHDMVALIAELASAGIPVAVNAVNLFAGAVIWPLGCIYLVQQLFGRRVVPVLLTGVLSAAFGSFPLLMLDHGVLNPNVLSIALFPVALGAAVSALGLTPGNQNSPLIRWLLLIAVIPGMTLAHPSTTMALLAVLIPAACAVAWQKGLNGAPTGRYPLRTGKAWLPWVGVVAYIAVVAYLWTVLRPVEAASTWVPIQSTGQAIGEVISGTALGRPVTWALFILTAAGLAFLFAQRGTRWIGFMYVVLAGLFVVVSSFPQDELRMYLTGVWYNDSPRLAALVPVMAVPVAAYGGWKLLDWVGTLPAVASGLDRFRHRTASGPAYAAVAVVAAVALIGVSTYLTQKANIRQAAESARASYLVTPDSSLISTDELELLERLGEEVPPDAILAGNPWTGSALAYALSDRQTLQLHILATYGDDVDTIYNRLRDAPMDPEVCRAVESTSVDYVLDFGSQEVHGADHGFVGLRDLEETGAARLVDQVGDAKLYEITACK